MKIEIMNLKNFIVVKDIMIMIKVLNMIVIKEEGMIIIIKIIIKMKLGNPHLILLIVQTKQSIMIQELQTKKNTINIIITKKKVTIIDVQSFTEK